MLSYGEIIRHDQINDSCYYIETHAPDIAAQARPGQFCHIQVRPGISPLLRRPLSLHDIDIDRGMVGFLYQVRGEGTAVLRERSIGQKLSIIGPLGKGFDLAFTGNSAVLAGGGIGVAPLYALAKMLKGAGKDVTVLIGARSKHLVLGLEKFMQLNCEVNISTDDGSLGAKGFISELLIKRMAVSRPDFVYTCGPEIMMAKVERICREHGVPGQVSVEAHMGCGIGACLGCACERIQDAKGKYAKVCVDGPVFDMGEVRLNGAG